MLLFSFGHPYSCPEAQTVLRFFSKVEKVVERRTGPPVPLLKDLVIQYSELGFLRQTEESILCVTTPVYRPIVEDVFCSAESGQAWINQAQTSEVTKIHANQVEDRRD